MKDAPFNITTVLLAVLGVGLIGGGIFAVILNALGAGTFFGAFLAAFLTVPLGSVVRLAVARGAADLAGARGESPMAFSLPIRLAIGAAVAAGVAYVFSLSTFYSFGFLMGAVAGLITQMVIIVIFYVAVVAKAK